MTDGMFHNEPDGTTPLDDVSGLLRDDITTREQLDEAEGLNIVSAVDWIDRGRLGDVFTVSFYRQLHRRMYDQVWEWSGVLRSETGAQPNIGVPPAMVPSELGRVAMEFAESWQARSESLLPSIARYHHTLVWVHPFNNGNGRWARLACDAVVERLAREPRLVWATDTLNADSSERSTYIAALRQADAGDLQPLEEYLSEQNPDR